MVTSHNRSVLHPVKVDCAGSNPVVIASVP